MVLLTMTASVVEALQITNIATLTATKDTSDEASREPTLSSPAVGNPISHGQIISLHNHLRPTDKDRFTLESLLRGASVYVPPPPPKAEPTEEYKALMARLRRDEEERTYERLIQKPGATRETFSHRFPGASMGTAHAFAEINRPRKADDIDDDFEFGDAQRQVTLIFNFLVSIFGVGGALWMLAKWWSTPARLFLALGGSIVVAIAEVIVYSLFNWRMIEGGRREKRKKEEKEILSTWVIGGQDEDTPAAAVHTLDGPTERATGIDSANHVRKRLIDVGNA
ncbi:endoplasmic reticulum-based factor for assembly of V-ATPase-domain-containing protein [Microdochium bolleyi]|uniref:Endoplasmic reticulum-based factor for assembly of V-ATPase-domain-containing protein n=1 Tax=Microdochium bolleyi TaxID=196109 RepID=A0A136IZU0_9PEZI|nr:endoplasmic reticulum-based factor for assembly of V-ATPase-domain-containing protein [Microdochium bolleyi]